MIRAVVLAGAAILVFSLPAEASKAKPHHNQHHHIQNRRHSNRSRHHPGVFHMAKGWPKGLSIPLIGVHAHVEDIALNGPTDLHAPFKWGDVAWYDKSARPGALGHSFIFWHLDSYCCAAIFWKLKDLKRGDIIKVWYKKRVLKFRVRWQHTYPNTALPVKFMYDPTTQHGLLLITCAGAFHTDGTGYDHKLFVYARLILPNGRLG